MGGNYVSPIIGPESQRSSQFVDLIKRQVLGKPLAHVYTTIEFQKRGLPHAHILVILSDDDKPRNPSQYDTIVSAEIPGAWITRGCIIS